jgi:hypothetical protein
LGESDFGVIMREAQRLLSQRTNAHGCLRTTAMNEAQAAPRIQTIDATLTIELPISFTNDVRVQARMVHA